MARKSENEKDVTMAAPAASENDAITPDSPGKAPKKPARTVKAKPAGASDPIVADKAPASSGPAVKEATSAKKAPGIKAAPDARPGPGNVESAQGGEGAPIANGGKVGDDPVAVGPASFEADEEEAPPKGASAYCGAVCARLKSLKLHGFCAALSFLSRLGCAKERGEEEMRAAVAFYPLVGLLLGFLALIPVWLVPAGYFWLKAWVFSALMVWLTRGLHWDGLADLADALGSNCSGEEFQQVLKDSRSGVFAVLAVVFCALGYVFAAQSLLLREAWLPFVLAPALARCAPLYIANLSRPNAASTLGKLMERAVDLKVAVIWTCVPAVIAVLAGYILAAVLALAVAGALLYWLLNLAERHGGYNGDFMGAGVVLVELGALLAFALG